MDTFGERLRSEREDRGLSLRAVGESLGVDQQRLLALERNDFEALPDDAVMMDCLRAYAECLEVDAELMIEDYLREREKCLRRLEQAVSVKAAELERAAIPADPGRRERFPRWLAVAVIVTVVAVLGAWWMLSGDGTASGPKIAETAAAPAISNETSATAGAGSSATPEKSVATGPAETQPRSARPAPRSSSARSAPSGLSIPDSGVGTGVARLQLVGRGDRFREGTQVWFWTDVQGGSPGDRIEHVWLQDGAEALRVSLKIGGARWRTYSSKMLRRGSAGDWAVEARDEAGHVLARRQFVTIR